MSNPLPEMGMHIFSIITYPHVSVLGTNSVRSEQQLSTPYNRNDNPEFVLQTRAKPDPVAAAAAPLAGTEAIAYVCATVGWVLLVRWRCNVYRN